MTQRATGPRPLCVHTRQVTGNQFFRTIAKEILEYVVREMLNPELLRPARSNLAARRSW